MSDYWTKKKHIHAVQKSLHSSFVNCADDFVSSDLLLSIFQFL